MPPLYPKMRERPMEFRINYDAPLAEGLVFAGLGGRGCIGSMVYPDSSLYANHGRLVDMDAATDWVWDGKLRRFVLHFTGMSGEQVLFDKTVSETPLYTRMVWVVHGVVTGSYPQIFTKQPFYGFYEEPRGYVRAREHDPTGTRILDSSFNPFVSGEWFHAAVTYDNTTFRLYSNGVQSASVVNANKTIAMGPTQQFSDDYRYYTWDGGICDGLIWTRALVSEEISQLADPSNVDLRVGGVPLILPPRRRFWPVVSEQAVPKMVPWHLFQQVGA